MTNIGNEMKLSVMDISETYQATASIQLRTHPTHSTINFSELGKKLLESARNGDVDEVLELISTGAPFTTDWLGASPLHYASQYGHVETVQALLNAGIAKDARTKIERTALHVAAQEGHIDTVNVLVSFGADVDAKDMLRMTPLHWAVQRGHRSIMEILLDGGADVTVVNKFDKTPIDIAYDSGYQEFVPFLQNYKGKVRPKLNPIETPTPIKPKSSFTKNRGNKSQNMNRSFTNKSALHIKQETEDEMDGDNNMIRSMDFLESIAKSNKKDKDNNLLQNVISNGQTISLTEAGKLVLNTYKDQQNSSSNSNNVVSGKLNNTSGNSNSNKLITIFPQANNHIVLLANNQNTSKNNDSPNSSIKVINKKPVFTEIKNAKGINVNKLPFFQNKSGPQVIKRYVLTNNPNQQSSNNVKEDENKRLQDELKNLRKELEDYKELIIAKDLEIEKLKKKLNINNYD